MALEAGIPVFDDEYRIEYEDKKRDYGEDRFITIRRNAYTDLLYVCYTMRGHDKTRLISVRLADQSEKHIYARK